MSTYFFAPSPDLSTKEQPFATWENGFNDSQINDIIRIGDSLIPREATVGGHNGELHIETNIRKSKTSWISLNNETGWLYDSLAYIVRQLNGQFFEFDLDGFVEDFQYTVYDGSGDHYSWHIDKGSSTISPRKLSIVLQLTDPSEYEGGDLELFTSSTPIVAKKQKGIIYAFPSWILHRVTPVTSGVRRSLVVWVAGPKFR